MIFIGENIHVISKIVKDAFISRDDTTILRLIRAQENMDCIDLNVGPAKGEMENILPWLCKLVQDNSHCAISFDTSNTGEMRRGLSACADTGNAFINSTSADADRLDVIAKMAKDYNSNLIALTMN